MVGGIFWVGGSEWTFFMCGWRCLGIFLRVAGGEWGCGEVYLGWMDNFYGWAKVYFGWVELSGHLL